MLPVFDEQPFNGFVTSQLAWATFVLIVFFILHFTIASRDRAAVGEEGASATLRRWYMYVALLVGLLTMLSGAAFLLQLGWTRLILGSSDKYLYLSMPIGSALAGAALWAFHARTT